MKAAERTIPHVSLDKGEDNTRFRQEVYDIVADIPVGKVLTYAAVACLAGRKGDFGLVSYYLSIIPPGRDIPYHRVVSASGGLAPKFPQQRALLQAEGVVFKPNGQVDIRKCEWNLEEEKIDFVKEFFGRKE